MAATPHPAALWPTLPCSAHEVCSTRGNAANVGGAAADAAGLAAPVVAVTFAAVAAALWTPTCTHGRCCCCWCSRGGGWGTLAVELSTVLAVLHVPLSRVSSVLWVHADPRCCFCCCSYCGVTYGCRSFTAAVGGWGHDTPCAWGCCWCCGMKDVSLWLRL